MPSVPSVVPAGPVSVSNTSSWPSLSTTSLPWFGGASMTTRRKVSGRFCGKPGTGEDAAHGMGDEVQALVAAFVDRVRDVAQKPVDRRLLRGVAHVDKAEARRAQHLLHQDERTLGPAKAMQKDDAAFGGGRVGRATARPRPEGREWRRGRGRRDLCAWLSLAESVRPIQRIAGRVGRPGPEGRDGRKGHVRTGCRRWPCRPRRGPSRH